MNKANNDANADEKNPYEELNFQLARFERFVQSHSERAKTLVVAGDFDLFIGRQGEAWKLFYRPSYSTSDDDRYPLLDAPLRIKVAAVPLLPMLLQRMIEARQLQSQAVRNAAAELAVFLAELKAP